MGRAKEEMLRHEAHLHAAARYLVKRGELKCCPAHDEIYGGATWDLEGDFYRIAMADRNRGDNGPVPWAADMPAREFTDLLKEAYEDHPADECGRCAKQRDE